MEEGTANVEKANRTNHVVIKLLRTYQEASEGLGGLKSSDEGIAGSKRQLLIKPNFQTTSFFRNYTLYSYALTDN